MLLIEDSIVAGLSRYQTVCKKYFKTDEALNCGIAGDRMQYVLWKVKDLSFNPSVKDIVVHCGMINLNHNKPKATVDVIIKIGKVFQEKLAADVNVILTGLLLQDMNKSKRKNKI